jgi:hypothetical protein
LDAIKNRGTFKDYKKAKKAYVEAKKAAELVEAGLALLDSISAGSRKNRKKKALAKAKEATKEALVKTQETKSEAKEAKEATNVTKDSMKAGFQVYLEKAKKAMENAKGAMTAAIVSEQMEATHLLTYKVSLLKAQGEFLASC